MTQDELDNADGAEIFSLFRDQNHCWNFESEAGMERLNKIAEALGYKGDGFRYGSPLERFLQDNSGACDSIVKFIENTFKREHCEDWIESLSSSIKIEDDEEEDES